MMNASHSPRESKPPTPLRLLPSGFRERVAALLTAVADSRMTLRSDWYQHNGYYRFSIGEKIEAKPNTFTAKNTPNGATVVGYTGDGNYIVETPEGERQVHFKWNAENTFKPSSANRDLFDPARLEPSSAKNLTF